MLRHQFRQDTVGLLLRQQLRSSAQEDLHRRMASTVIQEVTLLQVLLPHHPLGDKPHPFVSIFDLYIITFYNFYIITLFNFYIITLSNFYIITLDFSPLKDCIVQEQQVLLAGSRRKEHTGDFFRSLVVLHT